MRFSELIRLLERNGFNLYKEKGSIRYYSKTGHDKLIRVIIRVRRKFRLGHVVLFLRQLELEKPDDRSKVLTSYRSNS